MAEFLRFFYFTQVKLADYLQREIKSSVTKDWFGFHVFVGFFYCLTRMLWVACVLCSLTLYVSVHGITCLVQLAC